MVDAYAESECPYAPRVGDFVQERLEDDPYSCIMTGIDVRQLCGVVTTPSFPANMLEIRAVMQSEILEGCEQSPFERLPQPEFGRCAAVEPHADVETVGTLRSRSKAQQHLRRDVFQETCVGLGLLARVVELIDDDHVEVIGGQILLEIQPS